ncbi:putative transcription factor interactor and regulator CCHC(Zn) family [Helianthus annuus]|nr:putative transcription factor interactor and regulator CCHC(Zn) family [Helianthus annuus]
MAEEFYNTFYNAFTSESSEISTVTPKTITKAINENIKHDNFYGTHSKPPTLESIEDYTWWKDRFINWAKTYAHESWFCLEFGYKRSTNDKGGETPLKNLSVDDKREFSAEQRMIALIQSSIRNDMFALLQHDGTSKYVWEALRVKAEGGKQIKKNKIALLKKEFDLFDCLSGESELQKQNKMSSSSHQQNVGLYYKGNLPSVKADSSPKTSFSCERIKEPQKNSSSYDPGYHSFSSKANSEEAEEILCNIALKLKNSTAMSINAAKKQMSFLTSVLESYEGLVAGKIGNSELTKEDYDQIDPEEMELIDIRWCLASCIHRAQKYMEITGKQSLGGPSTKLGFDKSKVTCFRSKQKGHFKRECRNSEVAKMEKPFNDEYYRKAIYHRSREEPKMIQNNPREKSRALTVFHDDEGFDWSQILPEEDRVVTAHGRNPSKSKHYVFVAEIQEENKEEKGTAEIKEKTIEEIMSEKTYRERNIAWNRMDDMQEEYESAVSNKRWDKKRECYFNRQGEPVVPKKDIIFEDVLLIIPRSVEYTNVEKDKTYAKRLEKDIRHVMISSLRKRDEERMKKNVDEMVNDLKKVAEDVKVEAVKVEVVKIEEEVVEEKVVTEKQLVDEEIMKKKEEKGSLNVDSVGDEGANDEKKEELKQTDAAENTEVPITEVNYDSEILKMVEQCKKCMEPCNACTEKK